MKLIIQLIFQLRRSQGNISSTGVLYFISDRHLKIQLDMCSVQLCSANNTLVDNSGIHTCSTTIQVLVNASVVKYAFDNITTVYTVNDFDGVNTFLSDDKRKHFRGFGE